MTLHSAPTPLEKDSVLEPQVEYWADLIWKIISYIWKSYMDLWAVKQKGANVFK